MLKAETPIHDDPLEGHEKMQMQKGPNGTEREQYKLYAPFTAFHSLAVRLREESTVKSTVIYFLSNAYKFFFIELTYSWIVNIY